MICLLKTQLGEKKDTISWIFWYLQLKAFLTDNISWINFKFWDNKSEICRPYTFFFFFEKVCMCELGEGQGERERPLSRLCTQQGAWQGTRTYTFLWNDEALNIQRVRSNLYFRLQWQYHLNVYLAWASGRLSFLSLFLNLLNSRSFLRKREGASPSGPLTWLSFISSHLVFPQ